MHVTDLLIDRRGTQNGVTMHVRDLLVDRRDIQNDVVMHVTDLLDVDGRDRQNGVTNACRSETQ